MGGAVLFTGAAAGLLVVFADVDHLTFGALPDQMTPHTRHILKAMT